MNKLILLRHGQSEWNLENRFTGWKNVPLTQKGEVEAKKAGELIKKYNISIDRVFSSVLERANRTAEIAIKQAKFNNLIENNKIIMTCTEKLNERDYGDLVGLNKQETAEKFGKDQVHIWRRSYNTPPPNGESLKDVVERVSPYFKENIKPLIDKGENILIAAHGNSLRAMMIELGMYKPEEISNIELPTGSPLCINLDQGRLVDFRYLD
ncbi:2,3-diphosphoglycerate-dependent phosphoglycerate mutase [Alphaproteobacteria bacterium]|nr:2,3-diphosphoglycerate-dependent phosphoglycerate mutase [Alphaproteobacteria bacterium]